MTSQRSTSALFAAETSDLNITWRPTRGSTLERPRTAVKAVRASIEANDPVKAKEALLQAEKILDSTASKKVLHKNAAARYKSRLNKAVKALG